MTWPDTPEELLDGPRGRRLCFELVSPWWEDCQVRATPAWRDLKFGSAEARPPQLGAELADHRRPTSPLGQTRPGAARLGRR